MTEKERPDGKAEKRLALGVKEKAAATPRTHVVARTHGTRVSWDTLLYPRASYATLMYQGPGSLARAPSGDEARVER